MSSTPASLSPCPLTSLGDHSFKTLLEDDYSVGKIGMKSKIVSKNGGTVNYKGTTGTESYKLSQEIKLQFPYKDRFLWVGSRPNETKMHIDWGTYEVGRKMNFFSNIKL
jgi:hypothetical protein